MKKQSNTFLFWTPRIIVMIFAAFISLFALDVFDEYENIQELAIALLMHLIPTAVILVSLVIAWRWGLFGAIFYFAAGLFYIFWAWGRFPIPVYFTISGPLFIVAILFFVSWYHRPRETTSAD